MERVSLAFEPGVRTSNGLVSPCLRVYMVSPPNSVSINSSAVSKILCK